MPRPHSASARAQAGITDYIRSHRLSPGDALPSEAALCEELGFSRTSVREAIQVLSSLDIVEVRHGHGTYVSGMSLDPLIHGLVLRMTLDSTRSVSTLNDVVDLRSAIDHSLADELATIWSARDPSELYATVNAMIAEHEAGRSFATHDQTFHRTLLAPVSNQLVVELASALWDVHMAVLPTLGIPMPEDIDITIRTHENIVDVLCEGDAAAYRAAVDEHYAPLRRAIEHAAGH
ncbi:FadR/GntR family transcriptional regulator [Corynebacterium timonense]|uniref:DNA-binding transcriptional regulator, FadR family n=1 Tax=Corynebacterium timonense TaxID=441500 RepID=A0A1H1NBN5_9CORY|nr:GntR family transcriptional regulator [Corynebacterium timonense]SDR96260.1 DNA-binding transcriptional regulator, FadR family [Corynebacterium timonense]